MYTETLKRSRDRAKALKLLSWVLLAERTLSVSEMQHALAWSLEATEPLDQGNLEDEHSMISLCMGLVTVSRETRWVGENVGYKLVYNGILSLHS